MVPKGTPRRNDEIWRGSHDRPIPATALSPPRREQSGWQRPGPQQAADPGRDGWIRAGARGGGRGLEGGRAAKRTFNKRCAEIAPLPRPALFTGARQLSGRVPPQSSALNTRADRARAPTLAATFDMVVWKEQGARFRSALTGDETRGRSADSSLRSRD